MLDPSRSLLRRAYKTDRLFDETVGGATTADVAVIRLDLPR